jgi:hypothetical protein
VDLGSGESAAWKSPWTRKSCWEEGKMFGARLMWFKLAERTLVRRNNCEMSPGPHQN